MGASNQSEPKKTSPSLIAQWARPMAIVVGIGLLAYLIVTVSNPTGFFGIAQATPSPPEERVENAPLELNPGQSINPADPSQYLSRREYFEEAFQIDRESYRIFEIAAAFTGKSVSEMPAFFSVQNEEEIWENLPPVPDDFSEVAFLLANGQFFALQGLDERYWKQFEFYPGAKENGLKYWTQPDPKQWAPNGYGTYPAEQWATLTTNDTEQFEATVFIYSGYGVQTYQGISLFWDASLGEYFDLSISPQTFILEPSFPQFESEWAKKITITGALKPGTPKGEYTIPINVGFPPEDKRKEWTLKYRSLYQDGAAGIRPSGNQIVLHVNVE